MKPFTLLWAALALVTGGLAVFYYLETASLKTVQLRQTAELQALNAELEQARSKTRSNLNPREGRRERRAGTTGTERPQLPLTTRKPNDPASDDPGMDLALAASLIPAFDKARERWKEKWVASHLKSISRKLKLTDLQKEALKSKLEAEAANQSFDLKTALAAENGKGLKRLMPKTKPDFSAGEENDAFSRILEETLSKEQFLTYESERITQQAKTVERQANSDLRRLSRSLELDTGQEDRIFEILVKTSSAYDTAMQVEAGAAEADQLDQLTPDEAIRKILNEDQLALYEAARPAKKKKREKNKKRKKS